MPQTTECALTHRLPSNTTTTARPPADLPPPPVEEGQGEVRLHTANAKSPAVPLPPPWERVGVEAAKKRVATKPHRTSSFIAIHRKPQTRRVAEDSTRLYGEATQHRMRLSEDGYTYTPSAQAHVKRAIARALGRVCNSNFPPLRSGGGAGRGCENRVATAFKTKYKQPIAHRLPSNTTTAARPSADLPPPPVGEGQDGVRLHTANAKSPAVLHSPPWERVGVGAAKKHAATQPHRTSSFTYTPSAQAYVNCPATP